MRPHGSPELLEERRRRVVTFLKQKLSLHEIPRRHNVFNERSGTVIAVAQSSQPQRAGYPLTFELADEKLPKKSWVKISQIRTLSVERIRKKISKVSDEELAIIVEGLNEIISA